MFCFAKIKYRYLPSHQLETNSRVRWRGIVMSHKYDTWGHSGIYIFFYHLTKTDFCLLRLVSISNIIIWWILTWCRSIMNNVILPSEVYFLCNSAWTLKHFHNLCSMFTFWSMECWPQMTFICKFVYCL